MRIILWTVPALLAVVLTATMIAACGGDSDDDDDGVTGDVFPTATMPETLPDPIIVRGTPLPPTNSQRYTVQDGDSLSSIAAEFDVSLDELLSVNDITDPTSLFVGQELIIPGGGATPEPQAQPTSAPTTAPAEEEEPTAEPTSDAGGETYTVQEGDSPASIAAQYGITADELMTANGITDPASLQVGQVLTIP